MADAIKEPKGQEASSQAKDKGGKPDESAHDAEHILREEKVETDNDGYQMDPIFGEEAVPNEAELTGEDPDETKAKEAEAAKKAEEDKKKADEEAAKKAEEDKKKADEKTSKEKKAADSESKEDKDGEKPPKGFVPTAALKEAREDLKDTKQDVRTLRQQNVDLQDRIARLEDPNRKVEAPHEKFGIEKLLTDEEYEELVDTDPAEAMKYDRKLRRYEAEQAEIRSKERSSDDAKAEADAIVAAATDRLAESVPGLLDDDGEKADELFKWANEHGLNDHFLSIITDPATAIWPEGEEEPLMLGNSAAEMVEFIHKLNDGLAKADPDKVRETILAEETERITKEVTAKIMAKIKKEGPDFVSLGEMPGGDEPELDTGEHYSEISWGKLSEQEKQSRLGG